MTCFKAFKTFKAAKAAAFPDLPVVRVGDLYLAPTHDNIIGFGLSSCEIIEPNGRIGGTITMRSLDRLGNANWATPRDAKTQPSRIFPEGAYSK